MSGSSKNGSGAGPVDLGDSESEGTIDTVEEDEKLDAAVRGAELRFDFDDLSMAAGASWRARLQRFSRRRRAASIIALGQSRGILSGLIKPGSMGSGSGSGGAGGAVDVSGLSFGGGMG